jgi:hypothetical protein
MEQIERKDGILEQRRKISADILMLDLSLKDRS